MDLLAGYESNDSDEEGCNTAPVQRRAAGKEPVSDRRHEDKPLVGTASLFANLPAPSRSNNNADLSGQSGKRVQWRVPINPAALKDVEEDVKPKKKPKSSKGGSLASFLPPPKNITRNTSLFGVGRVPASTSGLASATPPDSKQQPGTLQTDHSKGPTQENMVYNENLLYRVDESGSVLAEPAKHPAQEWPNSYSVSSLEGNNGVASSGYEYSSSERSVAAPYLGGLESLEQESAAHGSNGPEAPGLAMLQEELKKERERQMKLGRKPGKSPQIVCIDQEKLKYVAPTSNAAANALQNAFGPQYQAQLRKEAGDKGSKLARRKHQIGTLYHDVKMAEIEMLENRTKSQKSKAETAAKYGW
mmetsp:Transcript_24738/g.58878  ORF Transcript_24738/g.58878 Transcript_24738/m.58878 type:complete len:360 (-) Transcript_24738:112-1191(-)